MPLFISRLFFLLILFPTFANAFTCNRGTTAAITINLPSPISIPSNLNVGDMIGEYTGSPFLVSTCTDTSDITADLYYMTALGTYWTTGNDGAWVVKTSIEGLGFSFGGIATECSQTDWVTNGTWTKNLCQSTTRAIATNFTFTPKVRLYKIGNIPTGTTIPQILVGYAGRVVNNSNRYNSPMIYMSSTTAVVPACTVSTPTVNVDMGSVVKNQFNGVGTTAGKTSGFNIGLTCSAASPVSLNITGDNYNASLGLLNLVNSSAKGIAIQLLYNNQPLALNSVISVGKATSGQFAIPLQARYYQTSSITPGTANSTATFTLKYQ